MTAMFGRGSAPVIGFDLDLTLIDTRKATALALESVNATLGADIDVGEFVRHLGPPIRSELGHWIAEDTLDEAVALFRAGFVGPGLEFLEPLPGAAAALEAIAACGGRSIIITSRRQHIAEAALHACELSADVVVGGLTGIEKAPAMRQNSISCYLGDHRLDMAGAAAAGVPGVGVLTGSHSERELRDGGAALVLTSLLEFGRLLEGAIVA